MVLLAILATFAPLTDPEKVNMAFLIITSIPAKSHHMTVPHSLQSVLVRGTRAIQVNCNPARQIVNNASRVVY